MQPTILVTIRGNQGSIDLEVPGAMAVGELILALLTLYKSRLANNSSYGTDSWELGLANSRSPIDARSSLIQAGIMDGALLELQTKTSWIKRQKPWTPESIPGVVSWSHEPNDLRP